MATTSAITKPDDSTVAMPAPAPVHELSEFSMREADPARDFSTSYSSRLHNWIDRKQSFWGRGFGHEGAVSLTDRSSVFQFVKTAPFATADSASLPVGSSLLECDAEIYQEGLLRGAARLALLLVSIAARSLIFAGAFSITFLLCIVGTVTGILPAYLYFTQSPVEEGIEMQELPMRVTYSETEDI